MRARSLLSLACSCIPFVAASAQTTTLMSLSTGGTQANEDCQYAGVSGEGNLVVFGSVAANLVPGDTNGFTDVFARILASGTLVRVSVGNAGQQANGTSSWAAPSASGRVVAFTSDASNLVAADSNACADIFVRDLQQMTTTRVSVSGLGAQANGQSEIPGISGDGRFVIFVSPATNLVPGDTNGVSDVFMHDRVTGAMSRISVDSAGTQANGTSFDATISADGRYIAFTSLATNLVAGDTNSAIDVFVHDRVTAVVVRASLAHDGAQTQKACHYPAISNGGRYVAFMSGADNLVPGDTNGMADVFVRDTQLATTTRVSVAHHGQQANGHSMECDISPDGRFVAFLTEATNIVPGHTGRQVYVHDRQSGGVTCASVATGGLPADQTAFPAELTDDGRHVVYPSLASNLVAGDANLRDVFLTDLAGPAYDTYCFGDGSATPCPCGNASPVGAESGCRNSTTQPARLVALGFPSFASDTFVLSGTGMTNGSCLYFQGTARFGGGLGAVFGDGLRCVGGTLVRLGVRTNAAGASQYPGPGGAPISVQGATSIGSVRSYQAWYRDAVPFCAPEPWNLTNGLSTIWRP
jgi:Tol biopolymer transport system component